MDAIKKSKAYKIVGANLYELAFLVAAASTIGSYIISQVIDFVPCTFCWYQRIAMFPLPLILAAAVLRKDKLGYIYALPLSLIGVLLSGYHSLLQWGIISESEASSCSLVGPSCGEPEILWLGFITIPFGAFLSFSAISILMMISAKTGNKLHSDDGTKKKMLQMLIGLAITTFIALTIIKIAKQ